MKERERERERGRGGNKYSLDKSSPDKSSPDKKVLRPKAYPGFGQRTKGGRNFS